MRQVGQEGGGKFRVEVITIDKNIDICYNGIMKTKQITMKVIDRILFYRQLNLSLREIAKLIDGVSYETIRQILKKYQGKEINS